MPPVQIPLHLPAHAAGGWKTPFNFDLASMMLKIGDVLTLTVSARDTAGKDAPSEELRVLVSPLSIDLDAHERIDGLTAASNFAASLVEETAAAAKAIEEAGGPKQPSITRVSFRRRPCQPASDQAHRKPPRC